jgi:hypothetical protein
VHAHYVRVQVGQLSRISSRHTAAFAHAASRCGHVTQCAVLRSALRALFARGIGRCKIATAGSLAAKPALCKMAAARFV